MIGVKIVDGYPCNRGRRRRGDDEIKHTFVYVDVGAPGCAGDARVFAESALKVALEKNTLNLPSAEIIEPLMFINVKLFFHEPSCIGSSFVQ